MTNRPQSGDLWESLWREFFDQAQKQARAQLQAKGIFGEDLDIAAHDVATDGIWQAANAVRAIPGGGISELDGLVAGYVRFAAKEYLRQHRRRTSRGPLSGGGEADALSLGRHAAAGVDLDADQPVPAWRDPRLDASAGEPHADGSDGPFAGAILGLPGRRKPGPRPRPLPSAAFIAAVTEVVTEVIEFFAALEDLAQSAARFRAAAEDASQAVKAGDHRRVAAARKHFEGAGTGFADALRRRAVRVVETLEATPDLGSLVGPDGEWPMSSKPYSEALAIRDVGRALPVVETLTRGFQEAFLLPDPRRRSRRDKRRRRAGPPLGNRCVAAAFWASAQTFIQLGAAVDHARRRANPAWRRWNERSRKSFGECMTRLAATYDAKEQTRIFQEHSHAAGREPQVPRVPQPFPTETQIKAVAFEALRQAGRATSGTILALNVLAEPARGHWLFGLETFGEVVRSVIAHRVDQRVEGIVRAEESAPSGQSTGQPPSTGARRRPKARPR